MKDTIRKAYTEVIEILKYFSIDEVKKIPDEKIAMFLEYRDKEYKYIVDTNKEFKDLEMMQETRVIFNILYEEYWATDEQKEEMKQKEKEALKQIEEEKKKIYNPEDLFKNKKIDETEEHIENSNISISKSKENLFTKIINAFKNIFKR